MTTPSAPRRHHLRHPISTRICLVGRKLVDYERDGRVLLETVRERRGQLYGPAESVEMLSELRGMLVDVAWAERLGTPRGAMAIVGKALDCCENALAHVGTEHA